MCAVNFSNLVSSSNRFHEHPHAIHRKWLKNKGTISDILSLIPSKPFENLSFYIHVPFCDSDCPYCKFYHVAPKHKIISQYKKTTIKYLKYFLARLKIKEKGLKSIYLGGGSPPIVGMDFINDICFEIEKNYGSLANVEISSEMRSRDLIENINKNAILPEYLNRISFGLQTFSDVRHNFKRIHSGDELNDMIKWLGGNTDLDLCADLMYGLPGQSVYDHINDLKIIDGLPIDGLSIYRLNSKDDCFSTLSIAEESLCTDSHSKILNEWTKLTPANFYRSNEKSTYIKLSNSNKGNIIGIGPNALSKIGELSFYFDPSIRSFCDSSKLSYKLFSSQFDQNREINDLFVFGEMDISFLHSEHSEIISELVKNEMITQTGQKWLLTPNGIFWSRLIAAMVSDYHEGRCRGVMS